MSISNTKTKQIQGFAVKSAHTPLEAFSYDAPLVGPWDIELEITHCGICHSDLHLINDDWHITKFPFIPGHEIVGIIKNTGELVTEFQPGQRVGIGWQKSCCTHCEYCHQGEENLCAQQEATCVNHHGGFADSIVTDSRLAFLIPENLSSENAAPLLCGGATAFSPFITHNVNATKRIGVIGIGGLGHLALQYARAFGCEVYAFSSSPEKEAEARQFGADHFISGKNPNISNAIDLLICTSSEHISWQAYLDTLRPKGTLCLLGVPKDGIINVPIPNLIIGRKSICGSNVGGTSDIRNMLHFSAQHGIAAKTEVFPMSEVNTAIEKLAANQIRYRAVLKNK